MNPNARICHYLAISSLIGLIALSIAWEVFLAPLRPGGSWLILKALPLLLPLFGILRGKRYTYGTAQIPLVVTYHPAYLLRSPTEKRKAWEDLLFAKSVLASLS